MDCQYHLPKPLYDIVLNYASYNYALIFKDKKDNDNC